MTREEALTAFLEQNGWVDACRIPLAADASFRTYERLIKGGKSVVLMNSPLSERPDQFVLIDGLLCQAGVHAPAILASDTANGFLLLEDFGDNTFSRLLASGTDELSLYRTGIDTLIQIQKNVKIPETGISEYTFQTFMNGTLFLTDWFGRYVVPGGMSEDARQEFIDLWTPLIHRLTDLPKALVLMDYHVDNLMMTPAGDCGVLDFQDARIGPVTYDLMSLLEDERRDVSPAVREKLLNYYFSQCPDLDTPAIKQALSVTAVQRHTRVIGIFVRLALRDKKERYLKMIPAIWRQIEQHLDQPLFSRYRDWLNRYVPLEVRYTVFNPQGDI